MDMHPADCPKWEYDTHPNKNSILQQVLKATLIQLRNGDLDTQTLAADTRSIHFRFFCNLVPSDCSYYAGHYRGEDFRCLKYNQVGIQSDTRVGFPPHQIQGCMNELTDIVKEAVAALDEGMQIPNAQLSLKDKIVYIVAATCRIFELFLRIHPYVNGNGHMARFCIWSLLGRYELWPVSWPIDPRPNDPPYTDLIVSYRNGNRLPLEKFIIQSLISN
jgi:hypothetical protein